VWEKINIMLAKSPQMKNIFSNMANFPLPKENCIVDNTLFSTIQ
jgi:phage terminase large subunit-like protein